ncbi:MAG TPA: DUF6084 family protein [Bryobacteraceae bacterium]|jgi:hypothetical protein|nr:DUF6084 family protein [Bryobacteraceae bacterium]
MPELDFLVRGAAVSANAAIPAVELALEIVNRPASERIHTIVLRCQVQIETPRRRYTAQEGEALHDLFGEPERWSQTLRPLLWSNLSVVVPAFTGSATVALPLPCTFDFDAGANKFFYALDGGRIPLGLMFSGTVFHQPEGRHLQAAPISWSSGVRFDFPVELWKRCLDAYYPNTALLAVRRDVFERLYRYKVHHGLASLDEAIEQATEAPLAAGAR